MKIGNKTMVDLREMEKKRDSENGEVKIQEKKLTV